MDALMLGSVNVNDGVTYYLADGFDSGTGAPELANVESLLDGDRLAGGRTGNREISLPVVVVSSTRLGLAAAVAAISTQADQASFTLTHSPDDGLPVIYDCFRATVTKTSSLKTEKFGLVAQLTVSMQALPFARNPVATTRTVTLGAAALGTQIDSCDSLTVPGTLIGNSPTLDTTVKAEGTASIKTSSTSQVGFSRQFTSVQNLSAFTTVSFAQRLFTTDESAKASGLMQFRLTDSTGQYQVWIVQPGSSQSNFVRVSIALASPAYGTASLNLAAIQSYSITFDLSAAGNTNTLWVDDVRGAAGAAASGQVARIAAVQGTARTPISTMTITAPATKTHKQLLIARWNDQPATFTPVVSAGGVAADTEASGGTSLAASTVDLSLVSANFRPGSFLVYVRVRPASAQITTVSAQARVTSDNTATGGLRFGSATVNAAPVPFTTTAFQIIFVGELELPALPVSPENTTARTFLRIIGNFTNIDDVYLVPSDADVAFLSGLNDAVVQLASSSGMITALAGASETVLLGAAERQVSQGNFLLRPGDNEILFVDNTQSAGDPANAVVTLNYHERWHFERAV